MLPTKDSRASNERPSSLIRYRNGIEFSTNLGPYWELELRGNPIFTPDNCKRLRADLLPAPAAVRLEYKYYFALFVCRNEPDLAKVRIASILSHIISPLR